LLAAVSGIVQTINLFVFFL